MKLIVAMDENNGIGLNGKMPWHVSGDLKHFKKSTIGRILIVGRTTFNALNMPHGFPNRKTIVVTSKELPNQSESLYTAKDIDTAIMIANSLGKSREIFIAGGLSIYNQFLERDLISELIVSNIPDIHQVDTTFPPIDTSKFRLTMVVKEDGFIITYYTRNV